MSRKKRGKGRSRGMSPMMEWTLYPLLVAVILTVLIWAFSPFDQGPHLSLLMGASITLFGMYGYDKSKAEKGRSRIPEKALHLWSLLGGFIGGLAGMYFFRHKTRKPHFLLVIAVSAVLHLILHFVIRGLS